MKRLLLLIPAAVLVLVACKRKQAVWESDWQVPLLKDTLRLDQLVEENFLSVSGGYYELNIDRTIFDLDLEDIVKIPDTTVSNSYAISLMSLNVPPGTAFVNNVEDHVMDLNGAELKKIRVRSGGITVSAQNPVGTKCYFVVELPGVSLNGTTLTQQFVAPAGSSSNPGVVTGFVDLTGYEMDLRGANGTSFNRIQSKMLVTSDLQGPAVTVTNQDSVRFNFTMDNVKIDYARGYFGSQVVSDTITEYIEALGDITGGLIDLPESTLALEIENGIKVSARLMLTQLKNTNHEGNAVALSHPAVGSWTTINSATGDFYTLDPSETTLEFNPQNSNLEQFLENHGGSNEIGFKMQLNPWGNVSGGWDEIFPQSALKVKLTGDMPLSIGLTDLVMQDTFAFSFKQDFTQTHIAAGTMWLKATNAFPFSGVVTLYLMDAQGNTVATVNSSSEVASSVYGTIVNGVLQKQSTVEFDLPDSVLDNLENVTQLSVRLKLNTPNPSTNISEPVQIPAGAFFGMKVGAKLKLENRI
jgi:hypothetical protein